MGGGRWGGGPPGGGHRPPHPPPPRPPPPRLQPPELRQTPRQPPGAPLHRLAGDGLVALPRHHVVELHDHVGAQVPLDLHHALGREHAARAVEVTAELHAVLGDRAQVLEREHLEAARVREDRAVPRHEAVQSAQLAHEIVARAQVQVVGVREDHLRAEGTQLGGIERLHGRERPHRHERRRLDRAVRRAERAGAGPADGMRDGEREGHARPRGRGGGQLTGGSVRRRPASALALLGHTIAIASPYE